MPADDPIEQLIEEVKKEMEPNHAENDSLRVEFLGWHPDEGWKFPDSVDFDD